MSFKNEISINEFVHVQDGNNVVVAYSDSIPPKMSEIEHETRHVEDDDILGNAYESTMIYAQDPASARESEGLWFMVYGLWHMVYGLWSGVGS